MSKKIKLAKHTPAEIFDMLEDLQLSLEILEEKMDNIYDIVKSKPQRDYGYSNDDEYDDEKYTFAPPPIDIIIDARY